MGPDPGSGEEMVIQGLGALGHLLGCVALEKSFLFLDLLCLPLQDGISSISKVIEKILGKLLALPSTPMTCSQ